MGNGCALFHLIIDHNAERAKREQMFVIAATHCEGNHNLSIINEELFVSKSVLKVHGLFKDEYVLIGGYSINKKSH